MARHGVSGYRAKSNVQIGKIKRQSPICAQDLDVLSKIGQIILLDLAGQSGDASRRHDQFVARAFPLYLSMKKKRKTKNSRLGKVSAPKRSRRSIVP